MGTRGPVSDEECATAAAAVWFGGWWKRESQVQAGLRAVAIVNQGGRERVSRGKL